MLLLPEAQTLCCLASEHSHLTIETATPRALMLSQYQALWLRQCVDDDMQAVQGFKTRQVCTCLTRESSEWKTSLEPSSKLGFLHSHPCTESKATIVCHSSILIKIHPSNHFALSVAEWHTLQLASKPNSSASSFARKAYVSKQYSSQENRKTGWVAESSYCKYVLQTSTLLGESWA